jgi:predicted house-cleaning noncanonical NTP pyrophosphatase (MazG superfamily)
MSEKIYNKLVRDKIPSIITSKGQYPVIQFIEGVPLKLNLLSKLYEEIQEFKDNPCEEEMADIMEVIQGMIVAWGFDTKSVLQVKDKKKAERGGFKHGVYLEKVIEEEE